MSLHKPKYVVFEKFYPAVVPVGKSHKDVKIEGMKPTSAGFFHVFTNELGKMEVIVFGESESLELACNLMDANFLRTTLGLNDQT